METYQETMDQIHLLIRAGYPVIYIISPEESRVLDAIVRIFSAIRADYPTKRLLHWHAGSGLVEFTNIAAYGRENLDAPYPWLDMPGLNAQPTSRGNLAADQALTKIRISQPGNQDPTVDSLTVFFDIHPGLGHHQPLVRALRSTADSMRKYYDAYSAQNIAKTIIIVAPSASGLDKELDTDIIRIPFPLPEREELLQAIDRKLTNGDLAFPQSISVEDRKELGLSENDDYESTLKNALAGAGRGLTLEDFKLGLNKVRARRVPLSKRHVEDMLDLKAKAVSNRALTYTRNPKPPLGGLKMIREWISARKRAMRPEVRAQFRLPPPRGVVLCGVSGGGKSELAKLIAQEFDIALLRLDVGSLFGQYVGESEERAREALTMAEVLAPVVLFLDEIDKGFSGIDGPQGDGGVAARVFGYFLSWLSEKKDDVFVVCTANRFRELFRKFPEFGRKGRFDEIFYVALPSPDSRASIFEVHLQDEKDDLRLSQYQEQLTASCAACEIALPEGLSDDDLFASFCKLLGHASYSDSLTGAEIEYVVTVAKYNAFAENKRLAPAHLLAAAQQVKAHALYLDPNLQAEYLELEADARQSGWPIVT